MVGRPRAANGQYKGGGRPIVMVVMMGVRMWEGILWLLVSRFVKLPELLEVSLRGELGHVWRIHGARWSRHGGLECANAASLRRLLDEARRAGGRLTAHACPLLSQKSSGEALDGIDYGRAQITHVDTSG